MRNHRFSSFIERIPHIFETEQRLSRDLHYKNLANSLIMSESILSQFQTALMLRKNILLFQVLKFEYIFLLAVMVLFAVNGKIPKDRSWAKAKAMMSKVDPFLVNLIFILCLK